MRNPLVKWFVIWILGMSTLIVFWYFLGPKGRPISMQEVDCSTTQSSELYFKNIRSYFYQLEEHPESGFKIYRLKSSLETESHLPLMIVHNWRMNEAFVLIDQEKGIELPLQLIEQNGETVSLNNGSTDANYRFAAILYHIIDEEADFQLLSGKLEIQLSESEKKKLKRTLYDYFKLVGKLR